MPFIMPGMRIRHLPLSHFMENAAFAHQEDIFDEEQFRSDLGGRFPGAKVEYQTNGQDYKLIVRHDFIQATARGVIGEPGSVSYGAVKSSPQQP